MACKLAPSTDPKADFQGATEAPVKITIDSDSGKAFILTAAYPPGTPLDKDTSGNWLFNIRNGYVQLGILVEDPKPGDTVRIQEVCNEKNNTLREYHFDPVGPTQFFCIKGI